MVSDDTHDRTIALLEKHNYFGLGKQHVDIIKQENVPALMDNSAKIAIDAEEFKVITKPHGHGDVQGTTARHASRGVADFNGSGQGTSR